MAASKENKTDVKNLNTIHKKLTKEQLEAVTAGTFAEENPWSVSVDTTFLEGKEGTEYSVREANGVIIITT